MFTTTTKTMIRDDSIHISWSTRYCLSMVAKAMDSEQITSPDALAEKILSDWLETQHPELPKYLRERNQDDNAVRAALEVKLKQPSKEVTLSLCCNAPVRVKNSYEGTHYYECEKCGRPCGCNLGSP